MKYWFALLLLSLTSCQNDSFNRGYVISQSHLTEPVEESMTDTFEDAD